LRDLLGYCGELDKDGSFWNCYEKFWTNEELGREVYEGGGGMTL
jgi:hypothetical protein